MLLGKVQSGKTNAFTGVTALAMDNDFHIVVILTKNSSALVSQTIARMEKEFADFLGNSTEEGTLHISDIMELSATLTSQQKSSQNIIVVKKEKSNLPKIKKILKDYAKGSDKRCLIVDDEADVTGIGYQKKPGTDEFSLRAVSSGVNSLRTIMDCAFIQVTATPYSLYLQPDFDPNGEVLPVKPLETVLVPHGEDYIGGEYYFIRSQDQTHPATHLFFEVEPSEADLVSTTVSNKRGKNKPSLTDQRRFKEDQILTKTTLLPTFKHSLISFLLGVIYFREFHPDLNPAGESKYSKSKFAFVFHTSTQTDQHTALLHVIQLFFKKINLHLKNRKPNDKPDIVDNLLQAAYDDLSLSVNAHGYTMPSFQDMEAKFCQYIQTEQWSVIAANGKKEIDATTGKPSSKGGLDIHASGDLNLPAPCSIFVGGQILDRGITIPNMLGFYYTRNPETKQQDALLQHSRMFGYRKHLLPVTRFYTTKGLHDIMTTFTEFDMILRDDIAKGKQGNGVYFIKGEAPGTKGVIMSPCSPDKVLVSDFAIIRPNKRFLPVGFTPNPSQDFKKASQKINDILKNTDKKYSKTITIQEAKDLIKGAYSTFRKDSNVPTFESEDSMITNLLFLMQSHTELAVVIVRGKATNKYRGTKKSPNNTASQVFANAPDSPTDRAEVAKHYKETPVLLLLEQTGKQHSWGEKEFWWPVLVAQTEVPNYIYSKSDASKIVHATNE